MQDLPTYKLGSKINTRKRFSPSLCRRALFTLWLLYLYGYLHSSYWFGCCNPHTHTHTQGWEGFPIGKVSETVSTEHPLRTETTALRCWPTQLTAGPS